jgi:hypothetical protein
VIIAYIELLWNLTARWGLHLPCIYRVPCHSMIDHPNWPIISMPRFPPLFFKVYFSTTSLSSISVSTYLMLTN